MKTTVLAHRPDSLRDNLGENTISLWSILCIALLAFGCGSDDNSPQPEPEPTVMQLLTSGRWYIESISDVTFSDCNKHGWYEFFEDRNLVTEGYQLDINDNCVAQGIKSGTWELLSDTEILVTAETTIIKWTIINLTKNEFILSAEANGQTQAGVFDKTPGNG